MTPPPPPKAEARTVTVEQLQRWHSIISVGAVPQARSTAIAELQSLIEQEDEPIQAESKSQFKRMPALSAAAVPPEPQQARRVAGMRDEVEEMAQGFDGCMVEAVGGEIDVGEAIRTWAQQYDALAALALPQAAPIPQVEQWQVTDGQKLDFIDSLYSTHDRVGWLTFMLSVSQFGFRESAHKVILSQQQSEQKP